MTVHSQGYDMKTKKKFKTKSGVFAHGATKQIYFDQGDEWLSSVRFGSTVCGEEEYPVIIMNPRDMRKLAVFLVNCADEIDKRDH